MAVFFVRRRYPLRIDRLGLQLSDTAAGFRVVGQDAFMQWATALIDRSKMLCELFGASRCVLAGVRRGGLTT